MRTLPRLVAVTAVLAMPLALGACGSSGSSGDGSSQRATASAPASSPAADDAGGSEQQSGKPSKDEVVQGLVQFYATQGKTGDSATKLANCIAGKSYTKLSPRTLQAMKNGKPKQIDPADTAAFSKIAGQCAMSGAAD